MQVLSKISFIFATLCVLVACSTTDTTKTPRTASEQLLISTAIDRAIHDIRLPQIKGRKIKIITANFDCVDKLYAIAAFHQRFLEEGAEILIEEKSTDTTMIDDTPLTIEIISGGVGTNQSDIVLGIPAIPVALPFTSMAVSLPEMALYKSASQFAVAKFNVLVYDSKTGIIVASKRNVVGSAYKTDHGILMLIIWNASNLEPNTAAPFASLVFDYESPNFEYELHAIERDRELKRLHENHERKKEILKAQHK